MIIHDASWGMIHGKSANLLEGGGWKNLTARNLPDMLGDKIGMKWDPARALKLPTISICIVFQSEAIGDDGKSPKPLFGVETASFRGAVFDGFFCGFFGCP